MRGIRVYVWIKEMTVANSEGDMLSLPPKFSITLTLFLSIGIFVCPILLLTLVLNYDTNACFEFKLNNFSRKMMSNNKEDLL